MPDPEPPAEIEPAASPPTCEQTQREAAERPKSLRLLPKITADAVRLVWAASPRMLVASIALKLVSGIGLATALIFSQNLIGSVLSANAAATLPGIGVVAPQLAMVVGIVAMLGLVAAAGREVREILSETTARHAKQAIIDVASQVELSAYETPSFHDRLVRAASGGHRPIQMVDGLIGTIGAIASIGGIVVALLAIQPWLVPLLLLAGLPLLVGVMKAGQAMFGFHMRMTTVARARNYLYRLLTEKDPAKEVRAFGLGEYLNARHTVLYERHMAELRKTTRKRFRIAILSTLGLSATLGAAMAGLLALALSGQLELAETATAAGALLILGERITIAVNGIGDMYEAGLFVEDYTVRDADHIYVLDRGRIIEHGSHDQLMSATGGAGRSSAVGGVGRSSAVGGVGRSSVAGGAGRSSAGGGAGKSSVAGGAGISSTAGVYAELFTLPAAAYTDQPSPNGHRDVRGERPAVTTLGAATNQVNPAGDQPT